MNVTATVVPPAFSKVSIQINWAGGLRRDSGSLLGPPAEPLLQPRDVIGAEQEESFGIRQNHSMNVRQWDDLIRKHFVDHRYGAWFRILSRDNRKYSIKTIPKVGSGTSLYTTCEV